MWFNSIMFVPLLHPPKTDASMALLLLVILSVVVIGLIRFVGHLIDKGN